MKIIDLPSTTKPLTISQIVKDLLSPAEHFAQLLTNATSMEDAAWQEIRSWYEPMPIEFGCGFFDPLEIRRVVGSVCLVYGREEVTETLLTYLYLKHRQLFLTTDLDLYGYYGRYDVSPPWDNAAYEMITARAYSACAGLDGDVVDFHALDWDQIPFPAYFPDETFWQQLCLDYELPLGLFDYQKALDPVENALQALMHKPAGRPSPLSILDDLANWAQKIEETPGHPAAYVALIAHARLLQAMRKK